MDELYQIADGVFAREPFEKIAEKFNRTDIAVADLDQCLFPGFSQIALTRFMFKSLMRHPRLARDLKVKFKIFD